MTAKTGISDGDRADSYQRGYRNSMEADPYQGYPTMMTELIHGTEKQDLLSVFTCKAITWDISPLPGASDERADS